MRRALLATAFLALALPALPPVCWADAYADGIAAWGKVLGEYVDDQGRTDFVGLARDPEDLERFVGVLAELGPRTRPDLFDSAAKVMAYHVNAYNALAMHGVIDEGIPRNFSGFLQRAGFFRFRKVRVDGTATNLHDYENEIIRPFGDARVHFALNCMVRACPRLPTVPFKAQNLEQQLQKAALEFFNNPLHLRIDHANEELAVSEILKFYTEDFVASGRRQDLIGYVNRYLDADVPSTYRVRFIPYDWTVNQSPAG